VRERFGDELADDLKHLPDRRRRGHLASRLALDRALRLAQAELVERVAGLRYSLDGRPVLVSASGMAVSGICCSLAHTGRAGLAVIGPSPAGADIEPESRFGLEFATRIAESEERDLVTNAGIPSEVLPATVWTAKESVLKATGTGLRIDPRNVRIVARIPGGWRLHVEGRRQVPCDWDVASYGAAGCRLAVAHSAGSGPVSLDLHPTMWRRRGAEVAG
jgi:4'-phosphopantetheinyl transferase